VFALALALASQDSGLVWLYLAERFSAIGARVPRQTRPRFSPSRREHETALDYAARRKGDPASCRSIDQRVIGFISVGNYLLSSPLLQANVIVTFPDECGCHGDNVSDRRARRIVSGRVVANFKLNFVPASLATTTTTTTTNSMLASRMRHA